MAELPRSVSQDRVRRLSIDITLGKKPKAANADEREAIAILTRETEELRAKGLIIEHPFDTPG